MTALLSGFTSFPETLVGGFIDIIFPPVCPLCEETVEKQSVCSGCLERFRKVQRPKCTICGMPFLTEDDQDHPCGGCISEKIWFDRAGSLFLYEGRLSEAVRKLKYSKKSSLASPLGELLASHPISSKAYDIIIPVPLHIKRLRERGFNQSQLLAARVSGLLFIENRPCSLERIRETLPQAGMHRKERISNVKGAFRIRKNADVSGKRILLIDDVYTTGATVMECSRVLKKGGAEEVNVLTLGRVVVS